MISNVKKLFVLFHLLYKKLGEKLAEKQVMNGLLLLLNLAVYAFVSRMIKLHY